MAIETVAAAAAVDGQQAGKAAWAILAAMGFGGAIAMMFQYCDRPGAARDQGRLGSRPVGTDLDDHRLQLGILALHSSPAGVIGFVIFGAGLVMSAIAVAGPLMISGRPSKAIGIGISAGVLGDLNDVLPLAFSG